ncbi:MAG: ferredoxin [Chlorobiaceae bacterium]|nr:ferredoxin [Chlorobiaceae bacterium]
MANNQKKHSANIPGPYYVTSPDDPGGQGCIACTICFNAAPGFYSEDAEGYAYVSQQPASEAEIALCQGQLEACPASAIGNDG